MVKMVLSLPTLFDAEEFSKLVTLVVWGRYGKKGYYNGLVAPKLEWLRQGNKDFTAYGIDAEEIDPAFISAVEFLGKCADGLKYYFLNGNKVITDKDWWKPSFDFERDEYYSNEDAREAAEEYEEKLAEINGTKPRSYIEAEKKLNAYWAEKKFA